MSAWIFGLIFCIYLDGNMDNLHQQSWEHGSLEIFGDKLFIERTKSILSSLSVNNPNIDF